MQLCFIDATEHSTGESFWPDAKSSIYWFSLRGLIHTVALARGATQLTKAETVLNGFQSDPRRNHAALKRAVNEKSSQKSRLLVCLETDIRQELSTHTNKIIS